MGRDHRNLRVFEQADDLVVDIYRFTTGFPHSERFALRAQIRRGAISVAANIVEGCIRRSTADYLHFINMAMGSAAEVHYLVGLSARLGYATSDQVHPLEVGYNALLRGLGSLIKALSSQPEPAERATGRQKRALVRSPADPPAGHR